MDQRITESFHVESGGTVTLEAERCVIDVQTHEEPYVTVNLEPQDQVTAEYFKDIRVTTDQSDGNIFVKIELDQVKKSGWDRLKSTRPIKCDVGVPSAYNLNISTTAGGISVCDLDGMVSSKTSGGSITIGQVKGPVFAKTSGGSIDVKGSNHPVEIKTSGGGISIGNVEGDVKASTSGGGIRVSRTSGRALLHTSGGSITIEEANDTLEAITSGGSVTASILHQPKDHCRLETSGGSVTAYLSQDIAMNIHAQTSGGQVHSEFNIEGISDKKHMQGLLNGGGPELIMRTAGGGVHIRSLKGV